MSASPGGGGVTGAQVLSTALKLCVAPWCQVAGVALDIGSGIFGGMIPSMRS